MALNNIEGGQESLDSSSLLGRAKDIGHKLLDFYYENQQFKPAAAALAEEGRRQEEILRQSRNNLS